MIRYGLTCARGHGFEGWFRNAADFDSQAETGVLTCPACGSSEIAKALMAPAIGGGSKERPPESPAAAPMAAMAAAAGPAASATPLAAPDPRRAELIATLRKMRQMVTENAENVGRRFAEEARRMHYKETEARGIYGEASLADAKALVEEGIEIHPLPVLPEDGN